MKELRIGLEQARTELDEHRAVALDVTSSFVWPAVRNRIPGAIRMPPEPLLAHRDEADQMLRGVTGISPDRETIVYCT